MEYKCSAEHSLENAGLYYPGLTHMLHFISCINLPYFTTDVKIIVSACKICARVKLLFIQRNRETLMKTIRLVKRISIDFKGHLPLSTTFNKYSFIVIDEYFRFSLAFSCKDMATSMVKKCLNQLLTLCGTASFEFSDNASYF